MPRKPTTQTLKQQTLSLAEYCMAVIEAGILLAVVITPLYFNPRTEHTFEPDKAALLRTVVLIAILAWCIKAFEFTVSQRTTSGPYRQRSPAQSSAAQPSSPRTRARALLSGWQLLNTPLVRPILWVLCAWVLGTAFSVLPWISLWGSYERAQGLLTYLAYLILFFLAWDTLRTEAQKKRLVDIVLLVSLPIAVYAVLQRAGLDPLNFQTGGAAVTVRAISTLGNPIFLGAYLIMVMPLTVYRLGQALFPHEQDTAQNVQGVFYLGLLVLQGLALFFAQSRGPVLGLLAGTGFALLVLVARRYTRSILVGVVIFLIAGLILIVLLTALAPQTSGLGRLSRLIDPTSRTGQQRILVWEGVVNMVLADPSRLWVGYGPDVMRDTIGPYMPPEIVRLKPDRDFDRAHNAVIDWAAGTGLLGVTAYLLVVGTMLSHSLRRLGFTAQPWILAGAMAGGTALGGLGSWLILGRQWIGIGLPAGLLAGAGGYVLWYGLRSQHERRPLTRQEARLIAILAAVVGHVVETWVGIAILSTATLWWLYAALIARAAHAIDEQPTASAPLSSRPAPALVWGLLTGITLALFSYPLLTAGQMRGGLAWGVITTLTLLGGLLWLLQEAADGEEIPIQYIGVTVGAVLVLTGLNWLPWPPWDSSHSTVATFFYTLLAMLVLGWGLTGFRRRLIGPGGWGRRVAYMALLVSVLVLIWWGNVQPMRADVFYKEGLGLSMAGQLQPAIARFEKSVALAPREDRYHSGLGAAHTQIAQSIQDEAARIRALEQAEFHLQKAHQLDPYRADHLRNLGVFYQIRAQLGPEQESEMWYEKAIDFYLQAAQKNPVGIRTHIELADLYARLGRWAEARDRYIIALQLNDALVNAHLGLGDAYLRLQDYQQARQAYGRALEIDEAYVLQIKKQAVQQAPEDPVVRQSLALVYAQAGRLDEARAEAQMAQQLLGDTAPAWEQFMLALNESG